MTLAEERGEEAAEKEGEAMSVLDGPGEGTWSVFAQKVVEERDEARRERDEYKTRLAHAEADAEQAVYHATVERDEARADVTRLRAAIEQALVGGHLQCVCYGIPNEGCSPPCAKLREALSSKEKP